MNMQHLDPVSLASLIGAAALAATRLLTTLKPVWDRLPASLQGLFPVLVLVLPQIAAAALGVHTSLDLVNLVVLSVALVLPGVHSHTVGKPSGSAALMVLVFALSFAAGLACSSLGNVNWPKTVACLDPLRPGLVDVVADVLAGTGDVESDLATIGRNEGLEAVECAVKQIVQDIGTAPVAARASRQVQRGRAFLTKVQK